MQDATDPTSSHDIQRKGWPRFVMKQKVISIFYFTGVSVCLALSAVGGTAQQVSLVGDWTGESICVGGTNPSCHDEQVVYHISVDAADATKIKIAADKIVNGKPDWMGDIYLKYDASKQT